MREDIGRNLRAISAVLSCGQCHPLIVKVPTGEGVADDLTAQGSGLRAR